MNKIYTAVYIQKDIQNIKVNPVNQVKPVKQVTVKQVTVKQVTVKQVKPVNQVKKVKPVKITPYKSTRPAPKDL